MSSLKVLVAAILTCVFATSTANAQAPEAWYTSLTIKYVYAGQSGGRVAVAVNEPVNLGTCPNGSGSNEFALDVTNLFYKQMFMMIMTAYMTGKPINLYTNGACFGSGLLLTDVWLPM